MDNQTTISLAEAEKILEEATEAYKKADAAYRSAASEKCSCLNRLNDAQKHFDHTVNKIRDRAAAGSDWKQIIKRLGV